MFRTPSRPLHDPFTSSSGRTTPFAWTAPDRIASRASLLSPADAQLDVERTILIIDTFQPIRTTSHCWCNQEQTEETENRYRVPIILAEAPRCALDRIMLRRMSTKHSENSCVRPH